MDTWNDYGYKGSPKGTLVYVIIKEEDVDGSTKVETLYFPSEDTLRTSASHWAFNPNELIRVVESMQPEMYSLLIDAKKFRNHCEALYYEEHSRIRATHFRAGTIVKDELKE